jgi:hypothetical protein
MGARESRRARTNQVEHAREENPKNEPQTERFGKTQAACNSTKRQRGRDGANSKAGWRQGLRSCKLDHMNMWAWIGLAFASIIVVVVTLPLVLSSTGTRKRTGRKYLQRRLKTMGWGNPYDPNALPVACLDELVSMADIATRFGVIDSRVARNAEFVRSLDASADVLLLWRRNPNDSFFANDGGAKGSYRSIFEKYGVR